MTLEAREAGMIAMSVNSKGNRWSVDQMEPENLKSIAITREGLRWWKEKRGVNILLACS